MVARSLTVVQMLPELDAGGVERGTLELGSHLVQHGHRSIVISGGGRLVPQLESEGSEHVLWNVGKKSPLTLRYVPKLRKFLTQQKVDILHLRSRVPAWVGYLAWKSLPEKLRPRLVTTFHGFYSVNRYSAIMTRGEKIIAISAVIKDHIQTSYQIPADRIQLIYRGVDTSLFDPKKVSEARLAAIKKTWNIVGSKVPVIILPGRVTPLKGHDVFLKSLARIKALPWIAVCAGDINQNSSHIKYILGQVKSLGLEDRVRFTGHCHDISAALLTSDIVVSATTSHPEAFGRVAVEAQAMGKPIIATAHGGSLETVIDHQTGWLVAPGDDEDMAKALREALSNKTLAKEFGVSGMKWVRENFNVEKMCEKTLNLYINITTDPDIS